MPTPPSFGDQDYQQAMQRLLPRGRAWAKGAEATLSETLLALAPTYSRSTTAAAQLLVDAFVDTTVNLLPEWEASLGLPDACTPANPTFLQRQTAVSAKWAERGSQSLNYFTQLAGSLGYAITITEFAPFTVGDPVGQPLLGPAWTFTWQVNAPTFSIHQFEVGHDTVGEPLASWGNTNLLCELERLAPAQTTVLFSLGGVISGGGGGGTGPPTPNFTVSGGQIHDTTGALFKSKGINVLDDQLAVASTNSAAQPLSSLFSGINHVRLNTGATSGQGTAGAVYPPPSTYLAFVQQLTGYTKSGSVWTKTPGAQNIVVTIEDHDQNTGRGPYTGAALTKQTNFYSALGAYFAGNPCVWYGTQNEMGSSDGTYATSAIAAMSASHQAIYNALRSAGCTSIIQIGAGVGGSNIGTVGAGAGFVVADYATMYNIAWELHVYANNGASGVGYSNVLQLLQGQATADPSYGGSGGFGIAGCNTITSADGAVPIIVGEWGSATGNPSATDASDLAAAILATGVGSTAWGYYPGEADGGQWNLVSGGYNPTPVLTTWGTLVAGVI